MRELPAPPKPARTRAALIALALLLGACSTSSETDTTPSTDPSPSATVTPSVSPGRSADVVFTGGTVLAQDAGHTRGDAVALSSGKVLLVGTDDQVLALAGADTTVIDLAGRTVMPGFVDAHTHLFNDRDAWGVDLLGAQELALQVGTTSFANMYADEGFVKEMRDFDASGDLVVRTSIYLPWTDNCGEPTGDWWKAFSPDDDPANRLRMAGLKAFADGGSCREIAASQEILPGYGTGDLFLTDDQLDQLYADGEESGFQVAVHAQGDVAIRQVLEAMIRFDPQGTNPRRNRVEHNSMVTPDMYALYGDANPVATIFGMHPVCDPPAWTDFYEQNGEDWRSLFDANPDLHWSWHGDDPSLPPIDPLIEMDSLVTRQDVRDDGTVCEPPSWLADNALEVQEVMDLMTINGAYAIGRETVIGSLESGKLADLIVLDDDPTAPRGRIRDIAVLSTWIDGAPVWCREGSEANLCPGPGGPGTTPAPDTSGDPTIPVAVDHPVVATVRASGSLPGSPATAVLDGDLQNGWVSGDSSPQWIEFDLGAPTDVTAIRLYVDQDPSGRTIHEIYGGVHDDPGQLLATLDGTTSINEVLEVTGPFTVEFLRIFTPDSPSWVAWYEIEIDVA